MKMKKVILTLCAALACGSAQTQSLVDERIDSAVSSHRIIHVDDGKLKVDKPLTDDVREKIIAFYYDQFRNAQDPEAPYFMFMSKDDNMLMGIGGVVRMRAWYDWGGSVPSPGFVPLLIPMTPDPAQKHHLGTTPAGTCLYFRLMGESKLLGHYQAYIEANFNGYAASDFHLKKAYLTTRDFTIGYASTTFSDPAAVPSTVDAAGPTNKLSRTSVLVRYMPRISRHWLAAVSVETPDKQIGADGTSTEVCSDYIPDFAAFMQYDWGRAQHVRLAAIVRSMPYRDMLKKRNHNPLGWGVQLSSVNHPCRQLTAYITANYGAGYAGLGGDLSTGAYDLIADPATPGRLYAPRSFGWSLGLQYNFTPDLFVTLIGSQTRLLAQKQISPDEYKYGLLGTFNIFWNPSPRIQLGAQLDLAKRQNFSHKHRYARRFGLMGQFSF